MITQMIMKILASEFYQIVDTPIRLNCLQMHLLSESETDNGGHVKVLQRVIRFSLIKDSI